MENIIEVNDLEKSYDTFKLEIGNFTIKKGSIVGLIGENGAGKTTFIKCLLNIVNPGKGDIKIFNLDNKKEDYKIKEDIAVVLDNTFFPELLTPNDINIIMKNTYKKWDIDKFYRFLKDFGLKEDQNIKTLSKGMAKKLEIAVALSHNPKLLILDEPTSGLDPVVRNEILDLFLDFIKDENNSILFSTHITSDLEHIADYITFIDNGNIVLDEDKDELVNNYAVARMNIEDFKKIEKHDYISYKENRYNVDVLINNKKDFKKKYKDVTIDKITLEELMILYIKGVK